MANVFSMATHLRPTPPLTVTVTGKGYCLVKRRWQKGDQIDLALKMPVEQITAHPSARQVAGRVALQRGPVVYCLEEVDNGKNLHDILLPKRPIFTIKKGPKNLGSIPMIHAEASSRKTSDWKGTLYSADAGKSETRLIRAIPYYLWANRKPGEMTVWLRK